MLISSTLVLASCGGGGNEGGNEGGGNNGGNNGVDTPGGDAGDSAYDWDVTSLFFQMTSNSNGQELSSGCKRYMAGEDDTAVTDLDNDIRARNIQAANLTKVEIDYDYWPDSQGYGWTENVDRIVEQTKSGNVYMLQYIRYNVRTSFDKAFEDAMGIFYKTSNENASEERWHTILQDNNMMMTNMSERYQELYPTKKAQLDNLVKQYEDFKD